MKGFFMVVLIVIFNLFAVSCGGDSSNESNEESNASFDGSINGEAVSNEQDAAVEGQFGAQIGDKTIQIYLIPVAGTVIHIVGETSSTSTLPGNLAISEMTLVDLTGAYSYKSGTVSIDKCPGAIGDIFTGKLKDVVFENDDPSATDTKKVSGSFSVTVYAVAAPNLDCEGGNEVPDDSVSCGYSAEVCENGVCCAFIECDNACFLSKCLSKCQDPNQAMECMQCTSDCATVDCGEHMTSQCQTAWDKLQSCMEKNSCDGLSDDAEIECATSNCCSELEAAFKE